MDRTGRAEANDRSRHPAAGQCLRECVAVVLDVGVDEVPHFMAMDKWTRCTTTGEWLPVGQGEPPDGRCPAWFSELCNFLCSRGYGLVETYARDGLEVDASGVVTIAFPLGTLLIVTLSAEPGSARPHHCVVAKAVMGQMEVVWDPKDGRPHEGPVRVVPMDRVVAKMLLLRPSAVSKGAASAQHQYQGSSLDGGTGDG